MVECESTAHMNLSPGHFGECDVTGENGHEESVADDIEDGHVGSGDFGKAEEERGEESHEETGGESEAGPAVGMLEEECLEECNDIHGVVEGHHGLGSERDGIVDDFEVIVGDLNVMLVEIAHDAVYGVLVDHDEPVEAQCGAHGQNHNDGHDHLARSRQYIVPNAGVAVKGTQVLGEENQLRGLHGIPLNGQIGPAEAVRGQNDEEDRGAAVAAVLEQISQGRSLPRPLRVSNVHRVGDEEEQNVQHGEPRARRGKFFAVGVGDIPCLAHACESRDGDHIRGDGCGYQTGYHVHCRPRGSVREGLVLDVFFPLREGSFLGWC